MRRAPWVLLLVLMSNAGCSSTDGPGPAAAAAVAPSGDPAGPPVRICAALEGVVDAVAVHRSGDGTVDHALAGLADAAVATGDAQLVATVTDAYQAWFVIWVTRDASQAVAAARSFGEALEDLARRCDPADVAQDGAG